MLGLLGVGLLAGCSEGDRGAWQRLGLPESASERAPTIGNLWIGSWIAAGIVGVIVWGLIGWAAVRYRRRNNVLPKQNRYNLPMEVFYTAAPFIIVGVLFYYTVVAQNRVTAMSPQPQHVVDVVGQKWSWTFNYREADNPAVGQDVYEVGTINATPDLYLPVNQSVRFNLSSPDVIHSFWVPAFYHKLDVIPGRLNSFEDTPNKIGVYRGKCTELCGTYHSAMLFNVHVVSVEDYNAYLKTLAAKGQVGVAKGPALPDVRGEEGSTSEPIARRGSQ
ncbi:MAG: cytochrome c oxidase subunit II [Actinomycetes bacterium]